MHILIVYTGVIPAKLYGGIARVIWSLGHELAKLGHRVTYLVKKGSYCDFADIRYIDESKPLIHQIPDSIDIVHFQNEPQDIEQVQISYIITMHGNKNNLIPLNQNTVFVSQNHAQRYSSNIFVYNGLDWDEYFKPDLNLKREYFHFLGNASWRVKNVKGSIDIVKKAGTEKLLVMGGVRFNFNMGIRFTFSNKVKFKGFVGGEEKERLINKSKGLIFPVLWNEPFGLAIIESLYYGCPIFGTPYGSLTEIVKPEFGYLSNNSDELAEAILNAGLYNKKTCHEYALDQFNSKRTALEYMKMYEIVLSGRKLNNTNPKLKEVQKEKFLDWE